jgi:hypothetical protein
MPIAACAAGEINLGVVAEEAERGDIASRQEAVGHVPRPAEDALASDRVHLGRARGFERRLAAERFLRLVRRAVGDHDRVFHRRPTPAR